MKVPTSAKGFRAIGVCLGLWFVLDGITTAAGLVPTSTEGTVALSARLAAGSVPFLVGVVLLLPHKHFARGIRGVALLGAYAIIVLAALAFAIAAVLDFGAGGRHWLIVPTSFVLFAIPFANALLLWSVSRGQRGD